MNLKSLGTLTPFGARVYGIAVIVAPLLFLASTVAYITEGNGINDGVLGGTIGVWSAFASVLAFAGILRLMEPTAPRRAMLLTLLALVAMASGVAFNVQAISLALLGPETEILDVVEGSDGIAVLAFLPWGLFVPLSFVLTGIALWRTETVPVWSGVLFIAAGVLFVASRPERIDVLAVIGDITMIAAMAPIGWAMLTASAAMTTAEVVPPAAARTEPLG